MTPGYSTRRSRGRCSRTSYKHTSSSRGGHNDNNNTSRVASNQRSDHGSQASTSVTLPSSPGSLNASNSHSGSTVLSTIEDDNDEEMGSDDSEDLPDMPPPNDDKSSRATDTDRDGGLVRRRCFRRVMGDDYSYDMGH